MNSVAGLRLLARCLDDATDPRTLGAELGRLADPAWLLQLADRQHVSAALYPALERKNLLQTLPAELRDYLDGVTTLCRQRNQRLLEQAAEVRDLLAGSRITPVYLKGVASLCTGLYPDLGERLTGDIDLLVEPAQLAQARESLLAAGYTRQFHPQAPPGHYEHCHQDAALLHPDRVAAVELHRRITLPRRAVRLFEVLAAEDTVIAPLGAGPCAVLAPTAALAHVFVHAMIQDSGFAMARLMLRPTYECHRLLAIAGAQVDWPRLRAAAGDSGCLKEWRAFVFMLARFFPGNVPLRPLDHAVGRLWWMLAAARLRWPRARRTGRGAYRRLRRWLPGAWQRGMGLTDHGWGGD